MTAAFASAERQENRAEQLESLRRRMLAMSGRHAQPEDLLPESARAGDWAGGAPGDGRGAVGGPVAAAEHGGVGDGGRRATRPSSASRISDCWPPWRWGPI